MNWKPIEGYDGLYEVSDTGLVRSLWYGKKRILSPRKRRGYLYVDFYRDGKAKHMYVHRLVANAFIPNPRGLATVNHKDEDKTNNDVANLEWLTQAENSRYSNSKPVLQLDRQGNVVHRLPSAHEASRRTGIAVQSISSACSGRLKSAGGFCWKYA